jgi:hypothetical protein
MQTCDMKRDGLRLGLGVISWGPGARAVTIVGDKWVGYVR